MSPVRRSTVLHLTELSHNSLLRQPTLLCHHSIDRNTNIKSPFHSSLYDSLQHQALAIIQPTALLLAKTVSIAILAYEAHTKAAYRKSIVLSHSCKPSGTTSQSLYGITPNLTVPIYRFTLRFPCRTERKSTFPKQGLHLPEYLKRIGDLKK